MGVTADPVVIVLVTGAVVAIGVASYSAWKTFGALKLAFAERLDRLPEGSMFERAKRKLSFWLRVGVHGLLFLALLAIVFGAARLAYRALT